ncbi:MAG: hypothetical protein OHK0046_12720 [Anaerolineae bacterium]
MLTAKEILAEDEVLVGDYNAEIAQWKNGKWVSTIPPVYLIHTDQRLIIQPHTRKRHDPAIIPNAYITGVSRLDAGFRHGVLIRLKTGHTIGLFISGDPEGTVLANLRLMMISRKIDRSKHHLELTSIQKMINYFTNNA